MAYEEPAYSVCYPPDRYAYTWSTATFPLRFSVRLIPGEPVAYTPWAMSVWTESPYDPPATCVYQTEYVSPEAETELGPYEIAGSIGVACRAQLAGTVQFKGAALIASGALAFNVNADGDEQLDLAMRILDTVRVQEAEAVEP